MFRKGVKAKEIIEHVRNKISDIAKFSEEKSLIITDPYCCIKNKKCVHPFENLRDILIDQNFHQLTLIASNRYIDEEEILQEQINQYFESLKIQTITIYTTEDFHDRFWIVNNWNAFVIGSSINAWKNEEEGINNKHFFVQDTLMSPTDTEVLKGLISTMKDESIKYIFEYKKKIKKYKL